MTQKKKALLYENDDLFISDEDKALDYNSLKGIISAKKDYNSAKKENNKIKMTEANQRAEAIRRENGYTAGTSGAGYYKESKPQKYNSPYSDEIEELYSKIIDREEFSYNAEEDPVYQAYKTIYEKKGTEAYNRTLAESSLKTGGIAGTNAISAASQAQAYYNSQLSNMIPQLYQAAYSRYNDEIERDYKYLDMLTRADDREYSRYMDNLNTYYKDRDYYTSLNNAELERVYRDERDRVEDFKWQSDYDFNVERAKVADDQWQKTYDYNKARDEIADKQWQQTFDYNKARDEIEDNHWLKNYNLSASRAASSSANQAFNQSKFEKQYKLDAIELAANLMKLQNDEGIYIDSDIIDELLGKN